MKTNLKKKLALVVALVCSTFFVQAQIVSKSDLDITEVGAKKFKKIPKKIYIKEFNVGYQYMEDGSALATNSDKSTEEVTMAVILDAGLTTDDIQNITDKAYVKFSTRLKDAGFELVGENEASKISFFQSGKVDKQIGGVPMNANGFIYTLPTGTTRIDKVTNVSNGISNVQNTVSSLSKGLGGLFKMADVLKKDTYVDPKIKISEELDIPVLDFGMNFSFLQLNNSSGGGMAILKGTTGLNAAAYKSILINKGDGKFGNVESLVQITPKKGKPIEIDGVIEKKTISKLVEANNHKSYMFGGVDYVLKSTIKQTRFVSADKGTYIGKVTQVLDEYLDNLASVIIDSFN